MASQTERLKFVPSPVSRNLELGSNTKVHCKAKGSPPPIVRWIKEGQQPYLEWPPHIRDDNGTLRFTGVLAQDAGRYTCVATSTQGLINATVRLDVIGTCLFLFLSRLSSRVTLLSRSSLDGK